MEIGQIARVTHEANKGYCESIGDYSQRSWEQAEEWQRQSAVAGVRAVVEGRAKSPEEQHQAWCDDKLRDGWKFGHIKDGEKKTHPCLVPYADLPPEQRRKDVLFRAVVAALTGPV
jgi:hypothetical protein